MAVQGEEGHYRATFEDRILMSDIVFLRAWVPVQPAQYYNPVSTLLNKCVSPTSTFSTAEY